MEGDFPLTLWWPSQSRFWNQLFRGDNPPEDCVPLSPCHLAFPAIREWRDQNGDTYRYVWRGDGRDNVVGINLSSYMGISPGAMHWYCRMSTPTPSTFNVAENRHYLIGGYGDDKPELYSLKVDAERFLIGTERDESGQLLGDAGTTSSRFDTSRDALIAGLFTATQSYGSEYEFEFTGRWDECDEAINHGLILIEEDEDGEYVSSTSLKRDRLLEVLRCLLQ